MICKLKDVILKSNTGLDAIRRAPIIKEFTGVKCIRITDVSQDKPYEEWGNTKVLSNDFAKFQLKTGDILIARTGATIGVNRYIDKNLSAVYNNGLIRLQINDNLAIPKFIYYVLNTAAYLGRINAVSSGTVAQPNMKMNDLLEFEFNLPDMIDQARIVKILNDLDNKIMMNNEINDNLQQQAFALFEERFPNIREGESRIGDYLSPKRGKNLLTKDAVLGNVPVVAGGLEPSTYHNKSNTGSPVITISASGANAGFVNLWNVPVWSSDSSFIDESITRNVYFWYVLLKKRQQEIFDSQTGSAQAHIYPKHIEVMPMAKINDDCMNSFNELVSPLFMAIGKNNIQNKKLSDLRDTLLPKLMSGEIDVSDIKLDL